MPENKLIYLDNAATTKVNDEVLSSFERAKKQYFANPSSIHTPGQEANRLLEKAREQILSTLGVNNDELIFTSGATEANNLAIKGYALRYQNRGKHIITTNIEHPSVLEAVKQLEAYAFDFLHLRVLYAVIATNNIACTALYRNAGYTPSSPLQAWTLESDAVLWIKIA